MFSMASTKLLRQFLYTGTDPDEKGLQYDVSSCKEVTSNTYSLLKNIVQDLDSKSVIDVIKEVYKEGTCYNKSFILRALAICTTIQNSGLTSLAYDCANDLCEDSKSILQFVELCEKFSKEKDDKTGWGRVRRRSVQKWYQKKRPYDVAFAVTACQSHNKWSHKDLLRLCHINPSSSLGLKILCSFIARGYGKFEEEMECDDENSDEVSQLSELLNAIVKIKSAGEGEEVATLYVKHKLSWDHVPCRWHNDPSMWKNLVNQVPLTVVLKNLPRLHNVKVLGNDSAWLKCVVERLMDSDEPKLHPLTYFWYRTIYEQGRHQKKKYKWAPSVEVISALDIAFYSSLKDNSLVVPSTKSIEVIVHFTAEDKSICNSAYHSCKRVTAALCYYLLSTEKSCEIKPYPYEEKISFAEKDTLHALERELPKADNNVTDCARSLIRAKTNKQDVDTFIVITDDVSTKKEGRTTRVKALKQYRQARKRNARLAVIALRGSRKPKPADEKRDDGILDIYGFDDQVPFLLNNFILEKF